MIREYAENYNVHLWKEALEEMKNIVQISGYWNW